MTCAVVDEVIELSVPSSIVSFFETQRGFESSATSTDGSFSGKGSFDEEGTASLPVPRSLPGGTYEVDVSAPLAVGGLFRGACTIALEGADDPTPVPARAETRDEVADNDPLPTGGVSIDAPGPPDNNRGLLAALGFATFGAMAAVFGLRRVLD